MISTSGRRACFNKSGSTPSIALDGDTIPGTANCRLASELRLPTVEPIGSTSSTSGRSACCNMSGKRRVTSASSMPGMAANGKLDAELRLLWPIIEPAGSKTISTSGNSSGLNSPNGTIMAPGWSNRSSLTRGRLVMELTLLPSSELTSIISMGGIAASSISGARNAAPSKW